MNPFRKHFWVHCWGNMWTQRNEDCMNEWEETIPGNWRRDDGAFIIKFNEHFFAWDSSSNQYGPYKTLKEAQEKVCPF